MKDAYFFSHDMNARNDEKIAELRSKYGFEGYGIFWALIEMMAEASDYKLSLSRINGIAIALPCECQWLTIFINDCISEPINLFESDSEYIWSESLLRRMEYKDAKRKKKQIAGKMGARVRWQSHDTPNGTAIVKNGKLNETKLNETKLNETKLNETKLNNTSKDLLTFLNQKKESITGKESKYSDYEPIQKTLSRPGITPENIRQLIINQTKNPYMQDNPQYYCPATLMRKSHYDKYLNTDYDEKSIEGGKSNVQKITESYMKKYGGASDEGI